MTANNYKYLANELLGVQQTLGWMDLIISSIADSVCVVDKDKNIIFANNCFSEMVGKHRVFLLGMQLDEVFKIQETDIVLKEYTENNLQHQDAKNASKIYEWKDENNHNHILRINSEYLPHLKQTVYLIQDITRQYSMSRMKNDFIDLASHQLRTPMTAIMNYSHMLNDGYYGALQKNQKDVAATIVESSERMIHLINGLLGITRAQNDMQKLNINTVSLNEVFKTIQSDVKHRVKLKQLDLSIAADLPLIKSDSALLFEIFSNLIVNAIQYTPSGGKVFVSSKVKKKCVVISIKDTGIGIPSEHQPYLFEQFSRADNAMEAYQEGTGLGLYLVKLLLDKIHGKISFESRVGVGTTFFVELPKEL